MSKQTPTVEWIVVESEADWDRLCAPAIPDISPPVNKRMNRNRSLWVVGTLLLLLTSVSGWWSYGKQNAWRQPAVDAAVTPPLAPGASRADRRSLVDTVLGDQMTRGWPRQFKQEESHGHAGPANPLANRLAAPIGIEITKIEMLGDRAVVSIITTAKLGDPAFRQTRFYQHTAAGWRQTAPDTALWGPARTLETPYFVFHFRQNDAPAVMVVAPALDALYLTLQRNFGLLLTLGAEKMIIEVRVTQTPGHGDPSLGVGFDGTDRLIVPSPARYLAPVELTDVALLEQTLALPLLAAVLTRARQQYAIGSAQQPLLNGLRLWQLWDLDLPLAVWRKDVVQWLYLHPTVAIPGRPVVLPGRYAELCTAHKLWLSSPAELNIPLGCIDLDQELWFFFAWGLRDPPTRLEHLILSIPYEEVRFHRGQSVALATLVEYAVVTYGRERLPALIAGLGQYESWATLIPAVYGVSAPEFETGWQAYLTVQYGIAPIDK